MVRRLHAGHHHRPGPRGHLGRVGAGTGTGGGAVRHTGPGLRRLLRGRGAEPDAYDAWIDRFAAGLGSGDVIVVLEPDSVAQSECLSARARADRFASLARAGRVLKAANPKARVYYDAGHSGWNAPAKQAAWLRQAGAATTASSDGVFSNVSNFHTTPDEIAYDRRVLDALGGPASLGAVIDTSRNGAGAPADGEWCDPSGRKLGRAPTLATGEARIDAYLWVKLPGSRTGARAVLGPSRRRTPTSWRAEPRRRCRSPRRTTTSPRRAAAPAS